jgi:hypothetical protein
MELFLFFTVKRGTWPCRYVDLAKLEDVSPEFEARSVEYHISSPHSQGSSQQGGDWPAEEPHTAERGHLGLVNGVEVVEEDQWGCMLDDIMVG